jgi:hypothetical protein
MMERIHSLASSCTLALACKVLLCLSGIGFRCAFTFCAKMCDFSRLCSGRKVTSWLGLVPVTVVKRRLAQADWYIQVRPQALEGASHGMCLGVRKGKAYSFEEASCVVHIRERARLLLEEAAAREGRLTLQGQCHHSSRAGKVHALHRPAGTGAGLNPGCIAPRRHPPTPSIAFPCQSPRKP